MSDLGNINDRLLIFGGPYSNLAATTAMQQRARELGLLPSQVICTGDVVAYCAEPGETVDLIRDWGIPVVMGNCEESLAFGEDDCGCGFEPGSECSVLAVTWYDYANRRMNAEQRRWMQGLPRSIDFQMAGRDFRIVHGSLDSINEFVFASGDSDQRLARIRQESVDVVIGGHSGIPFGQQLEDCYWLNAGVIGMPANDGSSHGWYLMLEPTGNGVEVSWHQLSYDYRKSRETTIAAGMTSYGEALASGHWPSIDILPPAEAGMTGRALQLDPLRISAASVSRAI